MTWLDNYIAHLPEDHQLLVQIIGVDKYLQALRALPSVKITFSRLHLSKAVEAYVLDHESLSTQYIADKLSITKHVVDHARQKLIRTGQIRNKKEHYNENQKKEIMRWIKDNPNVSTTNVAIRFGVGYPTIVGIRTRMRKEGMLPQRAKCA
jgi:Mn-dependent DtxR family transcriptional regulator